MDKNDAPITTPAGLGVEVYAGPTYTIIKEGKDRFYISAARVKERVCKILIKEEVGYVEEILANPGMTRVCEEGEGNEVNFYVNMSYKHVGEEDKPRLCDASTPCEGCQVCENGRCVDQDAKCSADKVCLNGSCLCHGNTYLDYVGKCHQCNEVIQTWIDMSEENIRKLLACPEMLLSNDGGVAHCDLPNQSVSINGYPETCNKCTNRSLTSNQAYCALKCPSGYYRGHLGTCFSCSEIIKTWIDMTEENLQRVYACPRMTVSKSASLASHCDLPDQSLDVGFSPETCNKCDNRFLTPNQAYCELK